jgi:hypothetical protein
MIEPSVIDLLGHLSKHYNAIIQGLESAQLSRSDPGRLVEKAQNP